MIVKIAPKRRDTKSSFDDLTKYITEEFDRDNIDISMPGFGDLTQYITRESVPDILTGLTVEKTIGVEVGNIVSLATAAKEMKAVASENKRAEDPVYHYILSWPHHERPEVKDMLAAARDTIEALGMLEHQYIIAIHANTDNLHAHIEVNRIHPITFKSHHIQWAQKTLHRAAREAEIKYGWDHDNGLYEVQVIDGQKVIVERGKGLTENTSGKAAVYEVWSGEESLETWCKNKPGTVLKKLLPTMSSWQELHDMLNAYSLELVDSGGGGMQIRTLAIDGQKAVTISASKAFRFMKRQELEAKFGLFRPYILNGDTNDSGNAGNPNIASIERNLIAAAENLRAIGSIDSTAQDAIRANAANTTAALNPSRSGYDEDNLGRSRRNDANKGAMNEPEYITSIEHNLAAAERNLRQIGDLDSDFATAARSRRASITDYAETIDIESRSVGSNSTSQGRRSDPVREYKRDPEKRLLAKLERAEVRKALFSRFEKEKLIHANVRKKMDSEVRARHKEAKQEVVQVNRKARFSLANDKTMSAAEKKQAYAMLAHQNLVRKETLEQKHKDELLQLKTAFKGLPINSWRSWVEDLAKDGDEAAIAALRGMIYQDERDRKKKLKEMEDGEGGETAFIVAPIGGTHDPRKAADLNYKLFAGRLYFNFNDGRAAFVDNGDTVSWDRALVDDDALRLSLKHATEKWGRRITVEGGDSAFQLRVLNMADSLGIEVINLTRQVTSSAPAAKPVTIPETIKPIIDTVNKSIMAEIQENSERIDIVQKVEKLEPGATIKDLPADNGVAIYEGKIIASNNEFIAQIINPNTVGLHRAKAFKKAPKLGVVAKVNYDKGNVVSVAVNNEKSKTKNR